MSRRQARLAVATARGVTMAFGALLHPVGVTVLCVSLGLALAMATLPALYPWSGRSGWVLLWGLAGYLCIVVAARLLPPSTPAPRSELRPLLRIREEIAGRLRRVQQPSGSGRRVELESVLEDGLGQIDDQIMPAMRELLDRQAELLAHLSLFARGKLPLPDRPHLERLNEIRDRRQRVIDACLQQAANADATLEAILQEGNDAVIADRARAWSDDLVFLHDAIKEAMQEEGTGVGPVRESRAEPGADEEPAEYQPAPIPIRPVPNELWQDPHFAALLEEGLRRLNNLGLLAKCELVQRLPRTLTESMRERLNGQSTDPSLLEQAQALHRVLSDAVERLRPPERVDSATPESLQYHIIHDEYVKEYSTKQIVAIYSISESTLHRYRRQGIDVMAGDLLKQEQRLARARDGVA